MTAPSDRDRQPSPRYVERLADEIRERLLPQLLLNSTIRNDGETGWLSKLIWWTVIEAARHEREINEQRV